MAVKFSNNAKTTLSSALTSSATSVSVADASNFPTLGTGDYTYATIAELSNSANLEIVKVTAISSNTLTIVRAQQGTSALSFSSGDLCEVRVTAGTIEEAITDVSDTLATVATTGAYSDLSGTPDLSSYIDLTDLSVSVNAAGTANLTYDNATGGFSYTPPDLSGYLTSYTETDTLASVTGRGSTTTNSVTVGGLTVDTNLYVDTTNDRVGINKSSPDEDLHIQGTGDTRLLIEGTGSQSPTTYNGVASIKLNSMQSGGLERYATWSVSAPSSNFEGSSVSFTGEKAASGFLVDGAMSYAGATFSFWTGNGMACKISDGGVQAASFQTTATGSTTAITLSDAGRVTTGENLVVTGDESVGGDLTVTGNITASAFYGDGSNLTGISTSSSFDGLTSKTGGTGIYRTSGGIQVGTSGSGMVALTVNDGGGNANVTFNDANNTPDNAGYNRGRITVNVDSTSSASMTLEVGSGGNAPNNGFIISESGVSTSGTVTASGGNSGNWNSAYSDTSAATNANTASTIVKRDANGDSSHRYLYATNVNMSSGVNTGTTPTRFAASYDSWLRWADAAVTRTGLNVPTRTGGDASGTWGISITGNAGTASNSSDSDKQTMHDTRAALLAPNSYPDKSIYGEFTNQINGSWWSAITAKGWSDGYAAWQLIGYSSTSTDNRLYFKNSHGSNNTWSGLQEVWHAGSDGSGSGLDADTVDGIQGASFLRADADDTATGTVTFNGRVNIRGHIDLSDNEYLYFGSGDDVEFFCNGSHMYTDLNSGIGNWYIRDGSTTRFTFDDAGDFTATGNVTAYSDVRLKEDIKTLDGSKVYEMRGVSFTKEGKAGSGVIAQELQKVAPELVMEQEVDGYLSVAYGNLVGYLIEAVKEQKKEIDRLKEMIECQ